MIGEIIDVIKPAKLFLQKNHLSLPELNSLIKLHGHQFNELDVRENNLLKEYGVARKERVVEWSKFQSLLRESTITKLDIEEDDFTEEQIDILKQIIAENCERLKVKFECPSDVRAKQSALEMLEIEKKYAAIKSNQDNTRAPSIPSQKFKRDTYNPLFFSHLIPSPLTEEAVNAKKEEESMAKQFSPRF